MKIEDVSITRSSDLKGTIQLNGTYTYEAFGPFGQGYNIKVTHGSDEAVLNYHWRDGPGAFVKSKQGKYEMSDQTVFQGGKKLLDLTAALDFEPLEEEIIIALFIINHHYYRKSGPFS